MSVISGMNVYIAENASRMGADGYRVVRIAMLGFDPKKYLEMVRRNPELKKEEFDFLKAHTTLTSELGLSAGRGVTVHHGSDVSEGVLLQGVTPNMAAIANYEPEDGRFISEIENQRRLNVACIGHDVKEKFFPGSSPIGQNIVIEGLPFQVVGFAKAKGSVFGQSQDNFVVIPVETYFKIWGTRGGMTFAGVAMDHAHLLQAQDEARVLLRAYRHLGPKDADTFSTLTSDALVDFWNQLTGAIAAAAVGVVSVFMVVGGVVIMNIMLAVVTERTHEIGIRKSVGARRKDILNQFLVESSMLAAMGGVMGVAFAWIVAVLVRNFTPVPMAVPVTAVIMGVALSAAVGLFFGIYPAQRASRLDPIEALRVEK
jgi:putative ABC transport system permease protein